MRKLLLLAILFLVLPPRPALAQGSITLDATAGFDGYYRVGMWMPVRVTIANTGADAEGEVQIVVYSDWRGKVTYSRSLSLPNQSRKQFLMYVHVAGYTREITVKLSYAVGGNAKRHNTVSTTLNLQPLDSQDLLCAVLSDDPASLHYLAGLPPIGQRRIYLTHLQTSDLPTQADALGSVDVLIIRNADTGKLSAGQRKALLGWVALGGHLIVCGGAEAELTAAGLTELLPVKVEGTLTTQDLSPLKTFTGIYITTDTPTVIARVRPLAGQTLAASQEDIFLQRSELDKGVIDYLALDPDLDPLRTWRGLEDLWSKILARDATPVIRDGSMQSQNFDAALVNIPNLDVPSVLLVIAFLLAYVLAVGPLNFLFLRLVDRRELAWVTIPVMVLLFSCAAYGGGLVLRGRKVIVSQVAVIRAYPQSKIAAARYFIGFYSPRRHRYDIRMPGDMLIYRPPDYYGGYGDAREDWLIEQGKYSRLRDLNIDVGTMRSVAARSVYSWSGIEAHLTYSPTVTTTVHIAGTLVNRTDTDLTNCALVWNGSMVAIADLPAWATQEVSVTLSPDEPLVAYRLATRIADELRAQNVEKRERERREAVINGLIGVNYYPPAPPAPLPPAKLPFNSDYQNQFTDLTLLAWSEKSPAAVGVEGMPAVVKATTLYIVPLPITSRDPTLVLMPRGSLQWRITSPAGYGGNPYNIYPASGDITIEFKLPSRVTIKRLFLHLNNQEQYFGGPMPVPDIAIQTPGRGWKKLAGLQWGANELSDPEQFRCPGDKIIVRVDTTTIPGPPLVLNFSLIGRRR